MRVCQMTAIVSRHMQKFCKSLSNRTVTEHDVTIIILAGMGSYLEGWIGELMAQETRTRHEQTLLVELTERLDRIEQHAKAKELK